MGGRSGKYARRHRRRKAADKAADKRRKAADERSYAKVCAVCEVYPLVCSYCNRQANPDDCRKKIRVDCVHKGPLMIGSLRNEAARRAHEAAGTMKWVAEEQQQGDKLY